MITKSLTGILSVSFCSIATQRPLQRGRNQGLRERVLGRVEMAVTPDHRAEDLRRQMAQQVVELGVRHG